MVTLHRGRERVDVAGIAFDEREALVAQVLREMPLASRREVVVQRDRIGLGLGEQAVGEVTADKSRAADDEPSGRLHR